jgi:hypothetical protein
LGKREKEKEMSIDDTLAKLKDIQKELYALSLELYSNHKVSIGVDTIEVKDRDRKYNTFQLSIQGTINA